jgi:hypothetical protein
MRLPGGPAIPLCGILGLVLIIITLRRAEWAAIGITGLAVGAWYAARPDPQLR